MIDLAAGPVPKSWYGLQLEGLADLRDPGASRSGRAASISEPAGFMLHDRASSRFPNRDETCPQL